MTNTSRRALLKGAALLAALSPASALASGAPALGMAEAAQEMPIKARFRRYSALMQRIRARNATQGSKAWRKVEVTADDLAALDLKREIEEAPITSMEDLALLLWVATGGLAGPHLPLQQKCQAFLDQEMDQ